MKANAIVRIVLFAILAAVLVAALVIGLLAGVFTARWSTSHTTTENLLLPSNEVSASQVRNLSIDWVSGSITIVPEDTDKITFQESGRIRTGDEMVWKLSGSTLVIEFCESSWTDWLWNTTSSKHLTITVPRAWVCQDLTIDAVSAQIEISGLAFEQIDLTSVSGRCNLTDCSANTVSMDTTSGDIHFSGSLQELDVDAISANCNVTLTNTPRDISLDSISGALRLTLPEDCGFTATVSSVSGNFSSDFPTSASGDRYTYGSGESHIDANTVSGDVVIYRG